jgi:aspartate aminotransferase
VAAEAALNGGLDCIKPMLVAFRERHDYMVAALNRMTGVRCLAGDGTFYAFPDMRQAIARFPGVEDDIGLTEYLIEHAGVAVVPGSAFGAPGYIRLSFATSMTNLETALNRMAAVFSK